VLLLPERSQIRRSNKRVKPAATVKPTNDDGELLLAPLETEKNPSLNVTDEVELCERGETDGDKVEEGLAGVDQRGRFSGRHSVGIPPGGL
jgi:hypothetical protein